MRRLAFALVLATLLAGCAVDETAVELRPTSGPAVVSVADGVTPVGGLPAVGPAPGSSHWHAAYVVRICDEVLAPFDDDNDPLGIHTHGDGLIHVHPFFEDSGFENATMGLFADAMGFTLADGELTLPAGGTWRDGDLCNGIPGRVFVDRWADPNPEVGVTRFFEGVADLRFEADGELYQIAFAPADSPPVVPPTWPLLYEVSNLLLQVPEPWIRIDPDASPESVRLYPVVDVGAEPCSADQIPEAVLDGAAACFEPGSPVFARGEAIVAARPVVFNRLPGVELTITPALRALILERFGGDDPPEGLAIAVEIEGEVVSAPLLPRPSASETRLILAGGLSEEAATDLAAILDG